MADEYIRREDALRAVQRQRGANRSPAQNEMLNRIKTDIIRAPAADVAPVVHGRWIDGAEDFTCGNHNAECSICRCYVSWDGCDEDFNYCPNCGARMDGVNEGE